jgi:DNA-binding MarR family transcriptional regulator
LLKMPQILCYFVHKAVDLDLIGRHLDALGIGRLAEWDVLAFIYLHGTSLASAEQISGLLGYNKAIVGAALESLTSTGLIQRSRNYHGVRFYRFTAAGPEDSQQRALEELMKVAKERPERLLLIRHLRKGAEEERRGRGGLHLA